MAEERVQLCLHCKEKRGKQENATHIASSTLSSDPRISGVRLHCYLKPSSTPRVPIAEILNPLDSIQ